MVNHDTTLEHINSDTLDCDVWEIIINLDCSTRLSVPDPKKSIMTYEVLCTCDSGFLCEHRLQWLATALQKLNN